MGLDFRGEDSPEKNADTADKAGQDKSSNRFGKLGRYREDTYRGDPDSDGFTAEDIPDFLRESAKESLKLVEDIARAYQKMHATDGREGVAEYTRLLQEVINDPTKNLLVITAGITALVHMKEAHGE